MQHLPPCNILCVLASVQHWLQHAWQQEHSAWGLASGARLHGTCSCGSMQPESLVPNSCVCARTRHHKAQVIGLPSKLKTGSSTGSLTITWAHTTAAATGAATGAAALSYGGSVSSNRGSSDHEASASRRPERRQHGCVHMQEGSRELQAFTREHAWLHGG